MLAHHLAELEGHAFGHAVQEIFCSMTRTAMDPSRGIDNRVTPSSMHWTGHDGLLSQEDGPRLWCCTLCAPAGLSVAFA